MRAEFNQINKHTPSSGEISFLGFQPHVYPYWLIIHPTELIAAEAVHDFVSRLFVRVLDIPDPDEGLLV